MRCAKFAQRTFFDRLKSFKPDVYSKTKRGKDMAGKKLNIKIPKILTTVISIAYIAIGVLFIIFPETSLNVLCIISGSVTVIYGLTKIIGYYSDDVYCLAFQFDLALGIFALIFGILLLVHPKYLVSMFPVFMGIFILVSGLFTFQTARESKFFGIKYWVILLIASFLCVAIGLLLIFNPFKSAVVMTAVVGASMILGGIERLTVALLTIKKSKNKVDSNGFIEVDCVDVKGDSDD